MFPEQFIISCQQAKMFRGMGDKKEWGGISHAVFSIKMRLHDKVVSDQTKQQITGVAVWTV